MAVQSESVGHRNPASVVEDAEDDTAGSGLKCDFDSLRVGMSGDVRQALLGHSVDGQLRVVREWREVGGEAPFDLDTARLGELARELGQCADEPQLLQHLGAQLSPDPSHLVEGLAHGVLGLFVVEPKQHACQHLTDLIVEAARDAAPLRLLGAQCSLTALPSLRFEPLEHLVERSSECSNLDPTLLRESVTRLEEIDLPHPFDQTIDRPEGMAKKQEVRREHHHQPHREVEPFDDRDPWRQREQERREDEQHCIDGEDSPEQWESREIDGWPERLRGF